MCDTGLCAPVQWLFVASTPGSYFFSVTVGKHQKADRTTEIFNAVATLPIVLTP